MEKMTFKTEINATAEKVWSVLFGETTYPLWANVFSEGSKAETDWKKGSKALFIDPSNRGMVSKIAESIPYKFLSIEHLGMYDNGKEDYESEEVKKWAGAMENYTLEEENGKTKLTIHMDMNNDPNMVAFFEKTWPTALAKVKELAEQDN